MSTEEQQPLLFATSPPAGPGPGTNIRPSLRRFLRSKTGHYSVLLLVSLDVSCIFADFLLALYVCEHTCRNVELEGELKNIDQVRRVEKAQQALGIVSLTFSSLFMVELLASVWAFGEQFFKSRFHIFDAAVIMASFIVDVCLKGVLEELGSIVVVLRLWRVFKIIEELSAGAADEMSEMQHKIDTIQKQNETLRAQLEQAKGSRREDLS